MGIPFIKMHGLGNDFVVFDTRSGAAAGLTLDAARARYIANRHEGIGCDQVILITPGDAQSDAGMAIWNADGGRAEACGNAARCVALILGGKSRLATAGGVILVDPQEHGAVVDMGRPRFDWRDIPLAMAMDTNHMPVAWDDMVTPAAVNVGNPHIVFFLDDLTAHDLAILGPRIEHDPLFPQGVNVNFAQIMGPEHIRLIVWERGAGLTRACGTGACATAIAAMRRRLTQRRVNVDLPGGALDIAWDDDDHIQMGGPATFVFRGEIDLDKMGLNKTDSAI